MNKSRGKKIVLFIEFKVNGDYPQTWDFIKKGLNSVNRYSNLWLVFLENQFIKRKW